MRHTCILILFLLQGISGWAQLDSLQYLDEVVLSDVKLHQHSSGQQVSVLNDSVLEGNDPFLTNLLKFNTPIYFKENGYGMVSSASFRGTTASQTAVVWNGININSQFTGQTDFNSLTTSGFDQVAVRHGGGSVLYGSGAVGGSVHLNNHFRFRDEFSTEVGLEYGSFNSFGGDLKTRLSSESTSSWISLSHQASDNDFKYLGTDRYNENGDYKISGVGLGFAHLLGNHHSIKFIADYTTGARGFSGTLTAPARSEHRDINNRNLLEWKANLNKFTSTLRLAYLDETYRYYENRHRENYSYGKARTGIAQYDLSYQLRDNLKLTGVAEYRYTDGEGSDVGDADRQVGSFSFLLNHRLNRFFYEVSLRGETSDRYDSPLLYSLSGGYQFNPAYSVRMNFSKNYRIPTFNDLFWRAGGKMDLEPEQSLQVDLGHHFRLGGFEMEVSTYVIKISDLLRWTPDPNGLWRPENTKDVLNYGLETIIGYQKSFGQHKFQATGTYSYVKTEDRTLGKQLMYVPGHKVTAGLGYSWKKLTYSYQFLYTDEVFTSSDNAYKLEGYEISNTGLYYSFEKPLKMRGGVEVRNLWNTYYESLPSRPMPGRSYHISLRIEI